MVCFVCLSENRVERGEDSWLIRRQILLEVLLKAGLKTLLLN
jgi:hypothetical protein